VRRRKKIVAPISSGLRMAVRTLLTCSDTRDIVKERVSATKQMITKPAT